MSKRRVDRELVDRGFYPDTDAAMRGIMAGAVSSNGYSFRAPGEQVNSGIPFHIKGIKRYVSRGGLKLEGAIKVFNVDVEDLVCVDVGCSTGGFTDCLLKNGARYVAAVDVGSAQFDWGLRNNPRVGLFEKTNIVGTDAQTLGGPFDLAVADVSFTGISIILDSVESLLSDSGKFLTLVKPQFEAFRDEVGEGGIVRDPQIHRDVLKRVAKVFDDARLNIQGVCSSPIQGAKGNHEFFFMTSFDEGMDSQSLENDIDTAVLNAWK